MNITSFSREELTRGLERARSNRNNSTNGSKSGSQTSDSVRMMFSPRSITSENIEDVYEIYSHISEGQYDTVVVVESHPGSAEKKLPMPSFKSVSTPLGDIPANDRLRNDFCDEDDDFFINDDAFDSNVSLYDQLMMLQCSLKDFSVLSIQITDENPYIVKELAYALEEILASKNALVVFCCDLEESHSDEFEKVLGLYRNENVSGLMNYLTGGTSSVQGAGTFITGLLVAGRWGLSLNFNHAGNGSAIRNGNGHRTPRNLIAGFAELQHQPIFG
jgi:predicted class III extradiol MEMO1 family dioxygenase